MFSYRPGKKFRAETSAVSQETVSQVGIGTTNSLRLAKTTSKRAISTSIPSQSYFGIRKQEDLVSATPDACSFLPFPNPHSARHSNHVVRISKVSNKRGETNLIVIENLIRGSSRNYRVVDESTWHTLTKH